MGGCAPAQGVSCCLGGCALGGVACVGSTVDTGCPPSGRSLSKFALRNEKVDSRSACTSLMLTSLTALLS